VNEHRIQRSLDDRNEHDSFRWEWASNINEYMFILFGEQIEGTTVNENSWGPSH